MNPLAYMTAKQVVERVTTALRQKRPPCFLLEIPPGCEDMPDVIGRVQNIFFKTPELADLCAQITADIVRNDDELVELLIREWLGKDATMGSLWYEQKDTVSDLPAPQRLKAFFNICMIEKGRSRIALVRRFDRIFYRMSSELLAVMRDLEHGILLITINASPLPYGDLYRRRARKEPGFTSDYGQAHVRLTVGPLPHDVAEQRWKDEYNLPLGERLDRAYFEVAFDLSGGLPTVFEKAAAYARNLGVYDQDIRKYKTELAEHLPEAFERLLRYDEEEGLRLAEAVARMHLGTASLLDKQILSDYHWHFLLIENEGGEFRLRSEALGRKALQILRSSGTRGSGVQPTLLYEHGQYLACRAMIEQSGPPPNRLLFCAVQMLAEAFGDAPGCLYFSPKVRWGQIKNSAIEAASMCHDELSRAEFDHWRRIAESHETQFQVNGDDIKKKMNIQEKMDLQELENAAIRLGIRVLAVAHDRNSVTAAYTAIPLIEDVLRHYVCLVLKLSTTGLEFVDIESWKIDTWWKEPKTFKFPEKIERLSGTYLTVLAAVKSTEKGTPLFGCPEDMAKLLRLLDERNFPAHYILTPNEQMSKGLITEATILLNKMCSHGGSSITVKELETWVRPPMRFLGK